MSAQLPLSGPPPHARAIVSSFFGICLGVILLLVGSLFFGIIHSDNAKYDHMVNTGTKTVATISKVNIKTERNATSSKSKQYEIKTLSYTVDGKRYTVDDREPVVFGRSQSKVGTTLNVYYEKSNPAKAIVEDERNDRKDSILFPVITLIFGGAITLISGITLFRHRSHLKVQKS